MSGDVANLASERRILVVEDEYLIAAGLAETIEVVGVEVVGWVANVGAALAAVARAADLDGATLEGTLSQEKIRRRRGTPVGA